MLHSSFEKTKSFLYENNLQHITEDIFFPSFIRLCMWNISLREWEAQIVLLLTCLPAEDQAASLNLCKRCTTPRSRWILDHRATTPYERSEWWLWRALKVQRSLGRMKLDEKTVRRKRTCQNKKEEMWGSLLRKSDREFVSKESETKPKKEPELCHWLKPGSDQ